MMWTVGQEVMVSDVNGPTREDRVKYVGRKIVRLEKASAEFDIESGRQRGDYSHKHLYSLEEHAELKRATELRKELLCRDVHVPYTMKASKLEAILKIVQS